MDPKENEHSGEIPKLDLEEEEFPKNDLTEVVVVHDETVAHELKKEPSRVSIAVIETIEDELEELEEHSPVPSIKETHSNTQVQFKIQAYLVRLHLNRLLDIFRLSILTNISSFLEKNKF